LASRREQDAFADDIAMSPWHCLVDKGPMGSINQARLHVYRRASARRHKNGGMPLREPDGMNDF